MAARWQDFCARLGVRYPIMQDGMGPAPTTDLAIAVSRAGGLGSVSTPGLTMADDEVRTLLVERMQRVADETDGVFAVNVPVGRLESGELLPATEVCISAAIEAKQAGGSIGERLVALTTSAGFPGEYSRRIRAAGLMHFAKVGSVRHAVKAAENDADVIIASGYEMGGHTHLKPVHTMVLAPQVIAEVDCPVIVSGGIFNGRGLAGVLAMGGVGVAMGTRFIATDEHEWHAAYKQMIVDAQEWDDVTYPGFYAPTRAIGNRGVTELYPAAKKELSIEEFDRWKEERIRMAQRDGEIEDGLLPAGQCAAAIKSVRPVSALIPEMMDEATALLADVASAAVVPVGSH